MTTSNIELFAAIQFAEDDTRQGPGRITGTLLTYNERASDRPMVFAQGALSWSDGVVLNLQHDRTKHLARFTPTPDGDRLMVDVRLPDTVAARDAVTLIRAGVLTGLSAEVVPESEDSAGGLRRVTKGQLVAAALVDGPSFKSSTVSVHAHQDKRRRIWQ